MRPPPSFHPSNKKNQLTPSAQPSPHRPTSLRAELSTFLTLFPHNTLLLALSAWSQPLLPLLADPIRTALQHALSQPSSSEEQEHHHRLATRRFAIRHEARVGTAHSVRAAFEAAVGDSPGSVELWTGHVRFCCGEGELWGRKAREVFYRAVGACPWAKEVYMLGFALARRGLLGAAELRGVVEAMVEKGVRVHVELDEFLGGWKGGGRR